MQKFTIIFLLSLTGQLFSDIGYAKEFIDSHRVDPSNCVLDVGWTEWKPYQYRAKDGSLVGLQIELLDLIGAKLGCKFNFHQYLWSTSVDMIRSGSLDLIGNASRNQEREKYSYFSDSYRQDLVVLYIRKQSKATYRDASLKELLEKYHFKLGIIEGSVYDGQIAELAQNKQFDEQIIHIKKSDKLLKLLVNGTIDGYFEDPLIFDKSINYEQFESAASVVSYPLAIKTGSIHFMFSKKRMTKNFVERFNRALLDIRVKYPEKFKWFNQ